MTGLGAIRDVPFSSLLWQAFRLWAPAYAFAMIVLALAWRYRKVDPAVAFCGLASIWGTLVVLFIGGKALLAGLSWK